MRFHWAWLRPLMQAPYVPTLGPVHPDLVSADLFDAVAGLSAGEFLPFDKDRRWFDAKEEHVITDEIVHQPGLTIIPTLLTRGRTVTIHHYSEHAPDVSELGERGRKLAALTGAAGVRLLWTQSAPGSGGRVMLKRFCPTPASDPQAPVSWLADAPQASTLEKMGLELGDEGRGFVFLAQRIAGGVDDGPVLVAVEDDRIVGALGPLGTITDAAGALTLAPSYFAVLPGYRRRGYGQALWRAAMAWGQERGATYKILQAATDSAAERLYAREGLETLGYVCSHAVGA